MTNVRALNIDIWYKAHLVLIKHHGIKALGGVEK